MCERVDSLEDRFAGDPTKYEALASRLEEAGSHEYTVSLQTTPATPVAGKPVS